STAMRPQLRSSDGSFPLRSCQSTRWVYTASAQAASTRLSARFRNTRILPNRVMLVPLAPINFRSLRRLRKFGPRLSAPQFQVSDVPLELEVFLRRLAELPLRLEQGLLQAGLLGQGLVAGSLGPGKFGLEVLDLFAAGGHQGPVVFRLLLGEL